MITGFSVYTVSHRVSPDMDQACLVSWIAPHLPIPRSYFLLPTTSYLVTQLFPLPLQKLHTLVQDGDVLGTDVHGQGIPQ